MEFTVGGRHLKLTMEQVAHAMRGVDPEPIREHLVELHGTVFPPKQVLATVTGWDRTSFTTMEAQRVLNRLGFVCRRAGQMPTGQPAWVLVGADEDVPLEQRVAALEAQVLTVQAALAGLHLRIEGLEAQ